MSFHLLRINLLVALGYLIGGLSGLWVAIPPSNAAPIWPASGIALAALLINGYRVLPGILLGGVIVQLKSFWDPTSIDTTLMSVLMGLTIGLIGTIQSGIAYRLTRDIYQDDPGLLKEKSVLWFLTLGGPIACLASATLSVLFLSIAGAIPGKFIPSSWLTWWLGDTVGVLLVTPVMLCLFAQPAHLWRTRVRGVLIPLCLMVPAVIAAFQYVNLLEKKNIESRFNEQTSAFLGEVEQTFQSFEELTIDLSEFIRLSDSLSEEKFAQFTQPKLDRHPEVHALEWIPRIPHPQRAAFERLTRGEISHFDDEGQPTPADVRPDYFPIQMINPLAGNEAALLFDVQSRDVAREALHSACATSRLAVTEPLRLVQETEDIFGMVYYAPVLQTSSDSSSICSGLMGVTATVIRLEEILGNLSRNFPSLAIEISSAASDTPFFSKTAGVLANHRVPSSLTFLHEESLTLGDEQWSFRLQPAGELAGLYTSTDITLILMGSMFICSIAGMGLLMLTGRAMSTEAEVVERTRDLAREVEAKEDIAKLLRLEKQALEMIARDDNLEEIIEEVCGQFRVLLGNVHTLLRLEDDESDLATYYRSEEFPELLAEVQRARDLKRSSESNATHRAASKKFRVEYLDQDPDWSSHRNILQKLELRTRWSTPIATGNDSTIGHLDLYFREAQSADLRAIDILTRIANILGISIQRRQAKERLSYLAAHDSLTGLLNRHEFERITGRIIENRRDSESTNALCFIDLDQFKVVNDNCGHAAGDEVLKQVALIVSENSPDHCHVARIGGDEFALLMLNQTLEQAEICCQSIQRAIEEYQFVWNNHSFRIGSSIGLVIIDDTSADQNELIRRADAACYMAKDRGRNRIHVYRENDSELSHRAGESRSASLIQNAIEQDSFTLFAQRIASLDGKPSNHFEVLVRMLGSNGELILPDSFIPSAERYHLASRVDRWVIQDTFRLLAQQPELLRVGLLANINLSGQSLADQSFPDFVRRELEKWGIEGQHICFEITETATVLNLSEARAFMTAAKAEGCRFALDDFGSGVSSFGYLKFLEFDFLKIDGIFIRDIANDPIDRAMVHSINSIGQVMGLKTIAEYVESEEIRQILRSTGIDLGQGSCIHNPEPLIELLASLTSRSA